jgi:hypothetical protein
VKRRKTLRKRILAEPDAVRKKCLAVFGRPKQTDLEMLAQAYIFARARPNSFKRIGELRELVRLLCFDFIDALDHLDLPAVKSLGNAISRPFAGGFQDVDRARVLFLKDWLVSNPGPMRIEEFMQFVRPDKVWEPSQAQALAKEFGIPIAKQRAGRKRPQRNF